MLWQIVYNMSFKINCGIKIEQNQWLVHVFKLIHFMQISPIKILTSNFC